MSEWISVDEKIPEPDTDVIVYSVTNGVDVTNYYAELNCWGNYHPVTHWQPLPAPPED